jgi:hypothetical protein
MFRPVSMMVAALTIAVLVPVGQQARAGGDPTESYTKCAKTCADCQLQCDACFKSCLALAKDGKKEHCKTAECCVDCAECCKLCATLCARQSTMCPAACVFCAKCCDDGAASCEKVGDSPQMKACAEECKKCAIACREMAKTVATK